MGYPSTSLFCHLWWFKSLLFFPPWQLGLHFRYATFFGGVMVARSSASLFGHLWCPKFPGLSPRCQLGIKLLSFSPRWLMVLGFSRSWRLGLRTRHLATFGGLIFSVALRPMRRHRARHNWSRSFLALKHVMTEVMPLSRKQWSYCGP